MKNNKYVSLIPARGGSKRLPGKNLKSLNGLPMISYSLQSSFDCVQISSTFVSTDSPDIFQVALSFPICDIGLRPEGLAEDQTSSLEVIQFEFERIEKKIGVVDHLVVLQPTSPLRTSADISAAIALFEQSSADTLTSVFKVESPQKSFWVSQGPFMIEIQPGQTSFETGPKLQENGAIYILSRKNILQGQFYGSKVVGYVMPQEKSIDIDTVEDFTRAEQWLKSN